LNSRPGPFFILPALLIWGTFHFKNGGHLAGWGFLFQGLAAIISGFVLNIMMVRLIGSPSGTLFSQFSYAIYGLASGGKSFSYIFEVHPEFRELPSSEGSLAIYKLAFDLIRDNPSLAIQGIFYNWSMAFSNQAYNLYSYVSGGNELMNGITRWCLYLLSVLGVVSWIKRPNPQSNLVIYASGGLLLSIPFVPPADAYGMRLYAAGIITIGLLPMLGLTYLFDYYLKFKEINKSSERQNIGNFSVLSSSILVALMVAGPLLTRGIGSSPKQLTISSCPPATDSIIVRRDTGNYIQLIREKDIALDWLPLFHTSTFKRNVHGMPDAYLAEWLEMLPSYTTLFYTLDYKSNKSVFVVLPTAEFASQEGIIELCGQWARDEALDQYQIFVATKSIINFK